MHSRDGSTFRVIQSSSFKPEKKDPRNKRNHETHEYKLHSRDLACRRFARGVGFARIPRNYRMQTLPDLALADAEVNV